MIKFKEGVLNNDKVEDSLKKENAQLRQELSIYKRREVYSNQINSLINQSATKDDLYKTLMLYSIELVSEMEISDGTIKIYTIKRYLEELLPNVIVDVYIGEALYSLNTKLRETGKLSSLYNIRTKDSSELENILDYVIEKSDLVEFSNVKMDELGIKDCTGFGVWVLQPLWKLVPGIVTFRLIGENRYFTPLEKEVIDVFMKIATTVVKSKILTRRVAEEAQANYEISIRDGLTKLYNRTLFNEDFLNNDNITAQDVYIVYTDLCKLKDINTNYGHVHADEVIKRLAVELDSYANSINGKAYRIGGDEFLAIIPRSVDKDSVKKATEKFQREWKLIEFDGGYEKFHSNISIGVYCSENSAETKDFAMSKADKLMYISKEERESEIVYNF